MIVFYYLKVKETVTKYLEEKLFVKVNQEKTTVAYIIGINVNLKRECKIKCATVI